MKFGLLIVVLAILYGIIIEVLQGVFANNRDADFYDVIANSFGAILGFTGLYFVKNKIFNKFF